MSNLFFTFTHFINRNVIRVLVSVICFSTLFGYLYPGVGRVLQPFSPACLFVMLYPMMIGLEFAELKQALTRFKVIALAIGVNFTISPLLAFLLANTFLSSYPEFAVGLILIGTVPCAGMVVTWTGMSRGSVPVALLVTTLSYLTGIFLIPFWMTLLAGKYVPIDPLGMMKTVVSIIVIPMLLGTITRSIILKKYGREFFLQIKPNFPAVSSLGMYVLFFISLSAQSRQLVQHPDYLLKLIVPALFFYPTLFALSAGLSRLLNLGYQDMAAVSFSIAGKNLAISLAIAVLFFSPLTVVVVAIMPLVQVIFMATYYKLSHRIQILWSGLPYKQAN
ncbi:arsenic resistance protein [Desulforamulus putei]|uniref:Arsenite efflux pump ArsB, ACR3 family n=1 Tax=Desulforamulus putei DSM 12395 TaxID=1121429 RepID=A0A1M4SAI7_9FIRM|nr:bile acid:sodium symporter [Desulforamulus putei]SHE29155.1 Arsenite efflux pump ArsB, ACR3 family [Desulforamulus putei DSM 12395]